MTTKATLLGLTALLIGAATLLGLQSHETVCRLERLEEAQRDHEARKSQREFLFFRIIPTLAALLGVAATAGWLR